MPARLTLSVGAARLALPVTAVAEVAALPALTRAPRTPELLLGVAQHRGGVTPVLSGAALAGTPAARPACMVVLRRDPPLALAVDAVVSLGESPAEPAPDGALEIEDEAGRRELDLDAVLKDAFAHLRSQKSGPALGAAPAAAGASRLGFLEFRLAGQAYALPLASVRAVGWAETTLLSTPGAEPALLGVEDWQGQAMPVVCLRRLLGLPPAAPAPRTLRIIVDLEGRPLALAIDSLAGVIRVAAERLAPAPDLFNLGPGEARVSQVLRGEGGGLVAVLTPPDLLSDERLARWREQAMERELAAPTAAPASAREARLILQLGSERYGLPLEAVEQVLAFPARLTRPPGAPAELLGVASVRGRSLPVLDPGRLLEVPDIAPPERLVVLRARGVLAGFAARAADEIVAFETGDILPAPHLDRLAGRSLPSAVRHEGGLIFLIDPQVLLDQAAAALAHQAGGAA